MSATKYETAYLVSRRNDINRHKSLAPLKGQLWGEVFKGLPRRRQRAPQKLDMRSKQLKKSPRERILPLNVASRVTIERHSTASKGGEMNEP